MKPIVKIGFVPSFRNYGDRPISAWAAQMRNEAVEVFKKVPGMQVVVPVVSPEDARVMDPVMGYVPDGAVWNLDEAEVVAEYFSREKVDGIIICALNFGDERSAAKIAEKLRVPVFLYATKEPEVPADPSMARVSDSYCGTLSIASALYRRKIAFHYGGIFFHQDPEFFEQLDDFVRAVAVVKGLKGARIGQVGVRPATFETVGYDETAMIQKFGQNVIYNEVSDIVLRAQHLADDDPKVMEMAASIRGEVAEVTISNEWVMKAAKMELILADFFTRNGLSAMAMQCWPAVQQMWGFSTCALFGRMTSRHMLTACEVDILGALAMLVSYNAALHETLPHFVDWTIQDRQDENRFLSWHCGNAPVCLAGNPAKTALRSRADMKGELPAEGKDASAGLYQFQIKPGKVTFTRLQEYDGEWKMLIAPGEIIPSDEVLAGTWAWVQVRDHAKLYRTLVEEGFVHHASMSHGDQTRSLLMACKFLDIKPILVD